MKELIAIQKELKAPKSNRNSFGNYNYRSCEDILEAVKPLLHRAGCFLTISDDIVAVLDRVYVKATATITNGTESITTTAFAREQTAKYNKEGKETMDHAQLTGSASSYARKYCLNGLFAIDDTKDADTNEQHMQSRNAPVQDVKATPQQIDGLQRMAVEMETTNPKGALFIDNAIKSGLTQAEAKTLIDRGNK